MQVLKEYIFLILITLCYMGKITHYFHINELLKHITQLRIAMMCSKHKIFYSFLFKKKSPEIKQLEDIFFFTTRFFFFFTSK